MLISKNCTCCQDFGKFRKIWHLVCTFYRNTKWYKIFVIHTHTIFKFYISWKRCSKSKLINKKYFSWKKPKNTLELILINDLHLWGTGPLWSSGSRMLTPSTLCYVNKYNQHYSSHSDGDRRYQNLITPCAIFHFGYPTLVLYHNWAIWLVQWRH